MREVALSELGSAPRLGVDSCVGGSETRSTAGTRDCLNAIRQILWRTLSAERFITVNLLGKLISILETKNLTKHKISTCGVFYVFTSRAAKNIVLYIDNRPTDVREKSFCVVSAALHQELPL